MYAVSCCSIDIERSENEVEIENVEIEIEKIEMSHEPYCADEVWNLPRRARLFARFQKLSSILHAATAQYLAGHPEMKAARLDLTLDPGKA